MFEKLQDLLSLSRLYSLSEWLLSVCIIISTSFQVDDFQPTLWLDHPHSPQSFQEIFLLGHPSPAQIEECSKDGSSLSFPWLIDDGHVCLL